MTKQKKKFPEGGGPTMIEYGLILALILVALIGGISQLGASANATFTTIGGNVNPPAVENGTTP